MLSKNLGRAQNAAQRGLPSNFHEGEFVHVACEKFLGGEKLFLRLRGWRCVESYISDCLFLIEDVRNCELSVVQATRLKFFSDLSLDTTATMPHVISSEICMQVQCLLKLVSTSDEIKLTVHWRGLSRDDDIHDPLQKKCEDVPTLQVRLLVRKSTDPALEMKAPRELGLSSV